MLKQLNQISPLLVASSSPFAPQKWVNEAHFRGAKGDIKGKLLAILIAMAMCLSAFQNEANEWVAEDARNRGNA